MEKKGKGVRWEERGKEGRRGEEEEETKGKREVI